MNYEIFSMSFCHWIIAELCLVWSQSNFAAEFQAFHRILNPEPDWIVFSYFLVFHTHSFSLIHFYFFPSILKPSSMYFFPLFPKTNTCQQNPISLCRLLIIYGYKLIHVNKNTAFLSNVCYSTVTCKVLLNWPHSKLGQYV